MLNARSVSWLFMTAVALSACGGGEEQPAQSPQQPPPGYYAQQPAPAQAQPAPAQQQPMQPAPVQAQPAPVQPGVAPAATAPAQPGGLTFPCQTDVNCIAHKCDTAAGKCIVPCATNADCQPGYHCMAPVCLPGQ